MPSKISWNSLLLILFISCSHKPIQEKRRAKREAAPAVSKNTLLKKSYSLEDSSGKFLLKKKVKYVDKKIVSLNQVFRDENSKVLLEKSLLVSSYGVNKKKQRVFNPEESQYVIWLDRKKYTSQISLDHKKKKLTLLTDGPSEKDQINKIYDFSRAKRICFFSQLVECLAAQKLTNQLLKNNKNPLEISILFDSYPFNKDQYNMNNYSLIQDGMIRYIDRFNLLHRFELILDGQRIVINMKDNGKLSSLYWVKQGLSLKEREGI